MALSLTLLWQALCSAGVSCVYTQPAVDSMWRLGLTWVDSNLFYGWDELAAAGARWWVLVWQVYWSMMLPRCWLVLYWAVHNPLLPSMFMHGPACSVWCLQPV
jgi:hypothetical protein